MHMAAAADRQRGLGPVRPSARASRCGSCSPTCRPEQLVELVDFRYLTDALTPDEALEILRRPREPARAERERTPARARATRPTRRRPAGSATPTRSSRRLCRRGASPTGFDPDQAQGRRRPRRRRAPLRASPARRSGPDSRLVRRRQPGAGTCRRRSSWMQRARARSTLTGSRSRPAPTTSSATPRSRARRRADRGRHRRARPEPGDLQAAPAGRRDRVLPDRRVPARRASTRTSRSCCWPPSSACRSARTPAASACASSSSTCRCSTTSRSAATLEDRVIEYVDHLHEHFIDPVRGRATAATGRRRRPGYSAEMRRESIDRAPVPRRRGLDGRRAWSARSYVEAARDRDRRRLRHRRWPPPRLLAARGRAGRRARPRRRRRADAARRGARPTSPTTPACAPRSPRPSQRLGGLDVLVNNAGIGAQGTVEDNADDEWHRVFDVNVVGMVRVAARGAAAPARVRRARAIVNTCSIAATAGLPQRALYSATKGAVLVADAGDGRRPRARGHPRELRQPGHRRHAVGRPPARRRPTTPAAERAALEARQPMGRLVTRRGGRRGDRLPRRARAPARRPARRCAVDGGMQGLRLRPKA